MQMPQVWVAAWKAACSCSALYLRVWGEDVGMPRWDEAGKSG